MALKSGEERLKEMEAEMALFEQEVLGGPVPVSGSPPVMETVPVALSVPAIPVVRPIIGTNTYRQVQQTLEARAASFVGPPPPVFAGPVPPVRPPMLRPAFVPHILQRPVGQRLPMMRGPPIAPPLPRPPPPPPMMLPPSLQGQAPQGPSPPIQHMAAAPQVSDMVPMVSAPPTRQGAPPPIKPTPSIIQAAPTVYSAPPAPVGHKRIDVRAQRQARMEELAARVAEQQAAVMAAGLLNKKESEDSITVIGPSMPEPESTHAEPVESASEDKKKAKVEKVKKCIRTAAGTSWEDASLLEWDPVLDQPDLCEGHAAGKDGTVWKCTQQGLRTGRAQSQNILTEVIGPNAHARHNIDDHLSAFMYLMDRVMLQRICDCTVAEVCRCGAVHGCQDDSAVRDTESRGELQT
ncbi:RNA-binding protein 42 isoform X2 [Epinephelus lanceolatus]